MGGAIYYPEVRPQLTNCTYTNNTAPYGPNIASYPVKVTINGTVSNKIHLVNIPSGQAYPYPTTFSLVDFDD